MKLTIEKQFGVYNVTATTEVADADVASLAKLGALYLFERQPSGAVEQKVIAPTEGWEVNKRGTGYVRPKDFTRNSWAFSPERAEKVKKAFEESPAKLDETREIVFEVVSITEYEGAEKEAQRKKATAMIDGMKVEDRRVMGVMLGVGADAGFAELVEAAHQKWFAKK